MVINSMIKARIGNFALRFAVTEKCFSPYHFTKIKKTLVFGINRAK